MPPGSNDVHICLCLVRYDMKTSHKGMGIDQDDYAAFNRHLAATLEKFNVPERERNEVMSFITSLENDIVEK